MQQQRGLTLIGLLFWAVVVAFLALIGIRAVPTVIEYYTIQKVVDRIAASNPSTVPAVRQEFDRFVQVEYSIQSIRSSDLQVTRRTTASSSPTPTTRKCRSPGRSTC